MENNNYFVETRSISLGNGLYIDAKIVLQNLIEDILLSCRSTSKFFTYYILTGKSDNVEIYVRDNQVILSQADSYNYHTNTYSDWKEEIITDNIDIVEKIRTCINLIKIYKL